MRAPALGGHEIVDVDVVAAHEVGQEPVAGRGPALVAVEQPRHAIALRVPRRITGVKLLLAELGPQLSHDGIEGGEPLVPRRKLDDLHQATAYFCPRGPEPTPPPKASPEERSIKVRTNARSPRA